MSESVQERLRGVHNTMNRNAIPKVRVKDLHTEAAEYIDKLEAALRFYADPDTYLFLGIVDDMDSYRILDDQGQRAREVLGE